jgi:hypothetical protein
MDPICVPQGKFFNQNSLFEAIAGRTETIG